MATAETGQAKGGWVDPNAGKVLLADYAEEWLRGKVRIFPRTREIYALQLRLHILPTIGDDVRPLGEVSLAGLTPGWCGPGTPPWRLNEARQQLRRRPRQRGWSDYVGTTYGTRRGRWRSAPGATTKELMARLGHANPRAAMVYQHASEDRDRVIADRLTAMAVDEGLVAVTTTSRRSRTTLSTESHQSVRPRSEGADPQLMTVECRDAVPSRTREQSLATDVVRVDEAGEVITVTINVT